MRRLSTTVPIADPDGVHELFVGLPRPAPGGPTNNFFNLNWLEFGGTGIAPPDDCPGSGPDHHPCTSARSDRKQNQR
jgi:hypothetical protein